MPHQLHRRHRHLRGRVLLRKCCDGGGEGGQAEHREVLEHTIVAHVVQRRKSAVDLLRVVVLGNVLEQLKHISPPIVELCGEPLERLEHPLERALLRIDMLALVQRHKHPQKPPLRIPKLLCPLCPLRLPHPLHLLAHLQKALVHELGHALHGVHAHVRVRVIRRHAQMRREDVEPDRDAVPIKEGDVEDPIDVVGHVCVLRHTRAVVDAREHVHEALVGQFSRIRAQQRQRPAQLPHVGLRPVLPHHALACADAGLHGADDVAHPARALGLVRGAHIRRAPPVDQGHVQTLEKSEKRDPPVPKRPCELKRERDEHAAQLQGAQRGAGRGGGGGGLAHLVQGRVAERGARERVA
mmetsp:Transcript_51547/g.125711  ORF Transcript_51547/g.125711 Transcript_51547/m.125711 type:complete len:354 (-) Transcript_51547:359-1420(-)